MQYEPIKNSLDRFIGDSLFMRKSLYFFLDLLLLRTWHVRKALRKIAADYPGEASILDAGSGLGQYSWRLSRMNKRWHIRAVDINREQVDDCRKFFTKAGAGSRVEFETADLTKLSDSSAYNLILSVDVMEHIEEDVLVFTNFHRALRQNGVLLISTPSDLGGSDVHGEGEESFIDEHVRDGYSIADITAKLSKAGFSKIKASYTYGKPGSISWKLSMKYPVTMLNKSYIFFILLPFYYLITFPVSVILNFIDLYSTHSSGTGLLVIAGK
jgi:SAM-dependent methyltransferase